MFCLKCKRLVPEGAKFCKNCGEAAYVQKSKLLPQHFKSKQWHLQQNSNPTSAVAVKTSDGKEETLLSWAKAFFKSSLKDLPKKAKRLSIFGSIILGVNLVFWSFDPYFSPAFLRPFAKIVSLVVFLTATYNDVIPKTIFWVILFTFGRRLFKKMRKEGFKQTFSHMGNTIPMLQDAINTLQDKAYGLLLIGGGIGFIIANNFSSYSRFSGARNKMDKFFIVFVMAFAISYVLGEANKTGVFKFVKLFHSDCCRLLRRPNTMTDQGVYLILSGFVAGLLLDAPLALMGWGYGGYILGGLAIFGAIIMNFMPSKSSGKVGP